MYENKIYFLSKLVNQLLMNSTESKIGLLGLEDAHTVLERGVKRGALKMDVQLEIRWVVVLVGRGGEGRGAVKLCHCEI